MPEKFINLDDAQGIFFSRQLESIKTQTYDVLHEPLNALECIPLASDAGSGAETITYRQYDEVGIAKIIANYADDLPRADVKGKEFSVIAKSIGDSYGYNVQEIRAAAMVPGKSLESRKADAAVRAQRELWNKIGFYGDSNAGLQGLLTNPNIPSFSVAADGNENGGSNSTEFQHKTPVQILRDLNKVVNDTVTATKNTEKPNTLLLPLAQFELISSTVFGTASDTTILEMFLKTNPYIKEVKNIHEISAEELAANGVTDFTGDIMIAYDKNPGKLTLEMPQGFEQFPVQEQGLEYVVPCHSRIAGVIIYYPFSLRIGEGI